MELREKENRNRMTVDNQHHLAPMDTDSDAAGNKKLHDLSNVFHDQREKAMAATSQEKKPPKTKSRDSAIYRCSYGSTNENRTTVVVPNNEPAFIIVGVHKSGSTSLLSHFRDHPQVLQTKKKFRRDAHFFDTNWYNQVVAGWRENDLTSANDKHCLALEQYMKLFETETILANSQTMDHGETNSTHHLPIVYL